MATLSVGGQLVATNDTLSNGVQDNITRLGTVASGVIGSGVTGTIGTGVTFPAGHVIQTQVKQIKATSMESSASTANVTSSWVSDAITTLKANSKILFRGTSFWAHCQDGALGQVHLQRAVTGGSTDQLGEDELVSMYYNRASGNNNQYEPLTLEYVDSPAVAAGTTITYSARYNRYSGSSSFYYVHNGGSVLVIIQEIAV